jgi:hypothetical protein
VKLAIFYHIAQIGLGAFIYQQQVHRLYASGLIKEADYIHFGVNGDNELFNVPDKIIVQYNQKENWGTEKETLMSLRDFSVENDDYKILYFHTKGVSKGDLYINSWRLMMEYYVIDKWKECVEELNNFTTVGCHLAAGFLDVGQGENNPLPMYMGNFWWANSSYINTLNSRALESNDRQEKEMWIGDSKFCNPKTLYNHHFFQLDPVNFNSYQYYFQEKDYVI